jgi:8-oxo-dGTP pyrophosphatase MutT (NUDIX family)
VPADFIEQLASQLQEPLPGEAAHARFSPRPPRSKPFSRGVPADARHAAALILLYPSANTGTPSSISAYSLPLTVRHASLPDHAGQISLPGGRIDAGETAEAAALREAEEEIGVDPASVRVLGSLTPLFVLVSRFVITPFVGVTPVRPAFRLAAREVSALVEVPVDHLRDVQNLHWGNRTREGYIVDFPYFRLDDHQVWGATAMILGEFLSLFDTDFTPPALPR